MSGEHIQNDGDDKNKFKLSKWDPAGGKPWITLGIFATRGGGKSFGLRDLLYKNRHRYHTVMVICPSEPMNNFYKTIIPDIFIYDELDEDAIDAVVAAFHRQEQLINNPPPWMGDDPNHPEKTLLVIMDDCMPAAKKFKEHPKIKEIYKAGRHSKIALYVVVQYITDLMCDCRPLLDIVIVLQQEGIKMKEKFRELLGGFERNEWNQVLDTYTDDFGCLVKDNQIKTTDVRKKYFWYKASPVPEDWKMNPDQWAFHKAHYFTGSSAKKVNWNDFVKKPMATINHDSLKTPTKGDKAKKDKNKPFDACLKLDEFGNLMDP